MQYIMEAKGYIIPDINNVKKKRKGTAKGNLGGVRKPSMREGGCGCWLRMTTMQFRRKIGPKCTWRKGNAALVITADVEFF